MKYEQLVPIIMKLQAKSLLFQQFKFADSVTEKLSDIEWWESHPGFLDDDVMILVQQSLAAAASSSGVEKEFSSYGLIHSEVRKRLGTEKSAK